MDLDFLRQAVGDDVLNYYGLSYGTLLGAVYANLFPDKVGGHVIYISYEPSLPGHLCFNPSLFPT